MHFFCPNELQWLLLVSFDIKNHLRGKKMKIKNQTTAEFTSVFDPRQVFSKKSLFDPFLRFQNFQKLKFLSFLVFHQKFFFLLYKITFALPKKFWGPKRKSSQKFWHVFGGDEKRPYSPPPRKKIVDFARIVVKREYLHFFVSMNNAVVCTNLDVYVSAKYKTHKT